jgi:proline iminopeptidase
VSLYPEINPYAWGHLDTGDGHACYWETCGNPAGKAALVLHGGPGSGCTPWHRRLFDPAAYRVVLFDQRGCGRSTPRATDPDAVLRGNTTLHLLADIENLRQHLAVDRWLVFGGSWGATLALLYAETHPERVTGLVLAGVTTTRRREIDWLYRGGVAPSLPEAWARFRQGVPPRDRDGDLVAAYHRLLFDPDPAVCAAAARSWCEWETATASPVQGPALSPRFIDPAYALVFARIVTHYFVHDAWLEDEQILRGAGALAGIPGVMVHGRRDLQAPLVTAWELARAWPAGELRIVEDAGHAVDHRAMTAEIVRATDQFSRR